MESYRGKQKEKQQWGNIELAQICLGPSVRGNAGEGFPDRLKGLQFYSEGSKDGLFTFHKTVSFFFFL